jgi:hypothetical protein
LPDLIVDMELSDLWRQASVEAPAPDDNNELIMHRRRKRTEAARAAKLKNSAGWQDQRRWTQTMCRSRSNVDGQAGDDVQAGATSMDTETKDQHKQAFTGSWKHYLQALARKSRWLAASVRARASYSYFVAMTSSISKIFCPTVVCDHAICTHIIDDTNMRFSKGILCRDEIVPTLNNIQMVYARSGDDLAFFRVHQPLVPLPRATAEVAWASSEFSN